MMTKVLCGSPGLSRPVVHKVGFTDPCGGALRGKVRQETLKVGPSKITARLSTTRHWENGITSPISSVTLRIY
jgi:hypothetical protein